MSTALASKIAIIYGAGGGVGPGVGRVFAREGAHVVLTGRTPEPLEAAAESIRAAGGSVETAVVDALDESAVDAHAASVVAAHGRIDISFNLISRGDVQGIPLLDMNVDDVLRAPVNGLRSSFLTARAAARAMSTQGSGVILHLNSASGAGAMPGMGSTGPADAAAESFMRYLAAEVGRSGVRVCGIWTAGIAETLSDAKVKEVSADGPGAAGALAMIAAASVLGRAPRLADVAETAAFLASDRAAGITGTMTNVSAGLVLR